MMDLLDANTSELLRLDNFINRAHLALAYLRQRLANHPDSTVVSAATRRIQAITLSLCDMACAAADDLDQIPPADLQHLDDLAGPCCEGQENEPLEDPTVFFRLWIDVERIDENANSYESLTHHDLISPKAVGTFTSLRQALEQALSLQGVYGGVALHAIDYSELAQAEKLELLAAGTGPEDLQVTISDDTPPLAECWAPPEQIGEDAYEANAPQSGPDEEYHVSEEDVPAPTGHEDD